MSRGPSPLLGYNTNVRHKGKLYHIQTEDSGVNHPHIITHLFADGGRIIASRKTDYAEHLGADNLQDLVKKLMQDQHKAMFIDLRDCVYDDDEDQPSALTAAATREAAAPPAVLQANASQLDVEALERAAEAKIARSAAARARPDSSRRGAGHYQQSIPAQSNVHVIDSSVARPEASIFGGQVLRGKSLDEVILSYLADDMGDEK